MLINATSLVVKELLRQSLSTGHRVKKGLQKLSTAKVYYLLQLIFSSASNSRFNLIFSKQFADNVILHYITLYKMALEVKQTKGMKQTKDQICLTFLTFQLLKYILSALQNFIQYNMVKMTCL